MLPHGWRPYHGIRRFPLRTVLRAILTLALLLGGGLGDWAADAADLFAAAAAPAHESCCCGEPAGPEDACPCPKPEGNRGPSRTLCGERATVTAAPATRRAQRRVQRRMEPRPEPAAWAVLNTENESPVMENGPRGRAPDLGRHLAALGAFRI